ncbi:MAG TPA: Ig-like domain repeat protein [Candidatus Acidoferrales bacterium]|nr:Ig-like domain repeat protein [Candidatus Acidoferrales bacterium]
MLSSSMAFLPQGSVSSRILRSAVWTAALFLFASIAAAQQTPVPARITQPIDASKLTVLKGNVHPLARAEFDRGPAPSSLPLNRMLLVLQRSSAQETALESLLDQQQDKSSPNYHQWLTPQQFGQQFGPADSDIQTVVSWLQSQGFQIDKIANGRGTIEFSGTAAQLQSAFHTEIDKYAVNGQTYMANATDPQIPAALSPVIAGVASMNGFPRQPMYRLAGIFAKSKETGQVTRLGGVTGETPTPSFTTSCGTNPDTGQPIPCYGVSPYDFATIYNTLPLWNASTPINGTGETIAIVARTNINPQDVSDFQTFFSLPANPPNIILNGPDPGIVQGDETESDLDVEWAGGVAPGAKIDLVVSQSTETSDGVDLSALYIVDNDLAPVMSESYGQCELGLGSSGNQFVSNLWQQAAAEGITVFVSSGDNGSAGCDFYRGAASPEPAQFGLEVNGLASTPYNVAVGGTDFNDLSNSALYWNSTSNSTTQASAKGYIPETTWNNSCTNALFAQVGFTTNAETNCNNAQLVNYILTVAGGGGKSACTTPTALSPANCAGGYAKPSWQSGNGVPQDSRRDVPDVSLFASNGFVGNFYMLCERDATGQQPCSTFEFLGIGGTSASSPAFAGIMALVDQKMGAPQGNANYVFYKLAAKSGSSCSSAANPASTCVFYDTPPGSTIAMPCLTGSPNCTTSHSGDAYGVLSGYSTAAGYDQATGLGSVNAANLVNDWNTVSNTPSTTTLILNNGSAVTITHGSSVPVSVSVSPTSPVPTGNVALLAQQNGTNTDFGTLTLGGSGTVSSNLSTLPGGTSYAVLAHYPGDANYKASDSNSITVTVSPEASKTALGAITFDPTTGQITSKNATTFPYGSPYILRSDVTNASGTLCFNASNKTSVYPCPTGNVALTDNGTPLDAGTFPLNSEGNTEDLPIQLTGGTHSLVANYSGDNSYTASSTTNAITVTSAPTTTKITGTTSPAIIGVPFTINVQTQSTSSGAVPSANYTVFDGTTALPTTVFSTTPQSQSGVVSLYAALSITLAAPSGQHSLSVHYNGDANYGTSASGGASVTALFPANMVLTATPTSTVYGQGNVVTLTATLRTTNSASNAALKPTGTISLSGSAGTVDSTPTLTTIQDSNGNWELQATATLAPQQTGQIYANYIGDANYEGASASTSIFVTIPDFSFSSSSTPMVITAGQAGSTTITVTPLTNYITTVSLNCSNMAFYGETCSISPQQLTLTNGAPQTATLTISTIGPSSTLTAVTLPNPWRDRPPFTGMRRVCWSLSSLAALAALLLFSLPQRRRFDSIAAGLAMLCLVTFLMGCGGSGAGNSGGSGGGEQPSNLPTKTTLTASAGKVAAGSAVTLTANVTSSNSVSGMVDFAWPNCGGTFGINQNLVNGTAQAQISSNSIGGPGACNIVAGYLGDPFDQPSQSGNVEIVFTGNSSQGVGGQISGLFHFTSVNVTLQ